MVALAEMTGAAGRFEIEFDRVGSDVFGGGDETGCRIDIAARADRNEQIAFGKCVGDAVHLKGHLAEPDDVGTQATG